MSKKEVDKTTAMFSEAEFCESPSLGQWYQDKRLSSLVPHLDQYRLDKCHDDGFLTLHAIFDLPEGVHRADFAGWHDEYKIRDYVARTRFHILSFLKMRHNGVPDAPVVEVEKSGDAEEGKDKGEDKVDGDEFDEPWVHETPAEFYASVGRHLNGNEVAEENDGGDAEDGDNGDGNGIGKDVNGHGNGGVDGGHR
jgi:hypothetical protein